CPTCPSPARSPNTVPRRAAMSDVASYLWLIPNLPLAASALITLLGPRLLRQHSHWPCVLACVLSCLLSILAFFSVYSRGHGEHDHHGSEPQVAVYYSWISVSGDNTRVAHDSLELGFALRADALSTQMLVMITFIGSLIAIYSIGYMHGEKGYP